jgi:hypothetical protein
MVKEIKFFRKQAVKAERMAQAAADPEISQSFLSMARAYRSQAEGQEKVRQKAALNFFDVARPRHSVKKRPPPLLEHRGRPTIQMSTGAVRLGEPEAASARFRVFRSPGASTVWR